MYRSTVELRFGDNAKKLPKRNEFEKLSAQFAQL
jgi:hypothetical protein